MHRTVHAIYDVKYEEVNLHKNQFIFLTRICENRGINLKELSILLRADKTTTTKITQKLIKAGYVYKEQDDKDKRIYRLYPTDKALDIYNTIIEEENRLIDICLSDFSKEEKSMVHRLARRMKENIKSDWYKLKNYNRSQ